MHSDLFRKRSNFTKDKKIHGTGFKVKSPKDYIDLQSFIRVQGSEEYPD